MNNGFKYMVIIYTKAYLTDFNDLEICCQGQACGGRILV